MAWFRRRKVDSVKVSSSGREPEKIINVDPAIIRATLIEALEKERYQVTYWQAEAALEKSLRESSLPDAELHRRADKAKAEVARLEELLDRNPS